jgi:hypothetical protein
LIYDEEGDEGESHGDISNIVRQLNKQKLHAQKDGSELNSKDKVARKSKLSNNDRGGSSGDMTEDYGSDVGSDDSFGNDNNSVSQGGNHKHKHKRRSKHDDQGRDYRCGCTKKYLSYPALYTHIKTKHNGITPKGTNTSQF